jgi:hypothetical protein
MNIKDLQALLKENQATLKVARKTVNNSKQLLKDELKIMLAELNKNMMQHKVYYNNQLITSVGVNKDNVELYKGGALLYLFFTKNINLKTFNKLFTIGEKYDSVEKFNITDFIKKG